MYLNDAIAQQNELANSLNGGKFADFANIDTAMRGGVESIGKLSAGLDALGATNSATAYALQIATSSLQVIAGFATVTAVVSKATEAYRARQLILASAETAVNSTNPIGLAKIALAVGVVGAVATTVIVASDYLSNPSTRNEIITTVAGIFAR